ncbi:transposase [Nocardia terpenica]
MPDDIITDSGSYSDIVFDILHLLNRKYRPQLANLPDQRLWRIDPAADYGPLDKAARGRIDLDKIVEHWEDMCRVAVSMHRGEVSAREVTRMNSRDGNPTSLGRPSPTTGESSRPSFSALCKRTRRAPLPREEVQNGGSPGSNLRAGSGAPAGCCIASRRSFDVGGGPQSMSRCPVSALAWFLNSSTWLLALIRKVSPLLSCFTTR